MSYSKMGHPCKSYRQLITPLTIAFWSLLLIIIVVHVYLDTGDRQLYLKNVPVNTFQTSNLVCPTPSLSNRMLPVTALSSFPGSGNTWMRHLLQQLTGILTGSVYRDANLKMNGFPGEGRTDGTVVAVKTHRCYKGRYERGILIIRNPYETFLAEFTRLNSASHTGKINVGHFKNWDKFLHKRVGKYKLFYSSWMQQKDLLPVFYDALKANVTHELVRISSFLKEAGIDAKPQCALRDSEGNFHRHSNGMSLPFFYTSDQRKMVNDLISNMSVIFSKKFVNMTLPMQYWKMS